MPSLTTRTSAPTVVDTTLPLPPEFPQVPDDVLKRFPSMQDWQDEVAQWWTKAQAALQDQTQTVSTAVATTNAKVDRNIRVTANGPGAFAQQIIAVSAMAALSGGIYVQSTAPLAPSINDIWIDTSPMSLTPPGAPITRYWDGTYWQLQTTIITGAAVSDERSARVTADGYLSGKYTLTVAAGNVVTGMNITSSTGGGTSISAVTFQADKFLIYNNTTGIAMFVLTAGYVQLGGVLTVDAIGTKLYIGAGNYANADTAFYVDAAGQFSLKDSLAWNGTILALKNGTVDVGQTGNLRGGQTAFNTGIGFFLGYGSGAYQLSIGDPAGNYLTWDGSTLTIAGGVMVYSVSPVSLSPAGQLFATTITITATASTAGATIRYTIDGSAVTPSSAVFPGGGLTLTSTATIRARAFVGTAVSAETVQTYTVFNTTPKVAAPSIGFNPESFRTNHATSSCSLSCSTAASTIHYRVNGGGYGAYTVPFTVNNLDYVEAYATAAGLTDSDVAGRSYDNNV